eukprot:gene5812-8018_t
MRSKLKLLVSLLLIHLHFSTPPPIICRDPDVGGTARNNDRKFMMIGSDSSGGAGLGNLLIFFPAAFYFAAITGRDIIISDKSVIGEMCSIIQCGFPFVSQLALAFPKILNEQTLAHVGEVKAVDFGNWVQGYREIDSHIVRASGYMPKSDWWVFFNTTTHCVKKITGCDLGDVMCAERHAFQRLIRGPFKSVLTTTEESRIHGVPDHFKHSILALPHSYAPRLDLAIHLRTQFHHFESFANGSDPNYQKEVYEWINSTEANQVFSSMQNRIQDMMRNEFKIVKNNNTQTKAIEGLNNENETDPIYLYLASDNELVKTYFADLLRKNPEFHRIQIMRVETKFIYHVKNLSKLKTASDYEGMMDLVFDWYALSLANTILAWRKGSTHLVSTFVHSAQKVSGTTERSDNTLGRGFGTRGFQLTRDRRGNMKFDLFWCYTFMEDFLI